MRIISFGDLYIDYYFSNNLVLGICGGKSNANIIANLSKYYKTAFFGVTGNDVQGKVAISSLNYLGVDTSNIKETVGHTKAFFVSKDGYSKTCPYCGRKLAYQESRFEPKDIIPLIQDDDYIIVDNLSDNVQKVLNSVSNKAFLDLSYIGDLLYLSLDELISILKNRFEIIKMNKKVYSSLRDKFKLDLVDFYELINPKLLIITTGCKETLVVFNSEVYEKAITEQTHEIDISGAEDSFFAEFIRTIIDNDLEINEKIISLAYMRASAIARFCVTNYGARTHLEELTKIKSYQECICGNITVE